MKKSLARLLFLLLVSIGLVAGTQGQASADPYPGTVTTSTSIEHKSKVKARKKFKVRVTVVAVGSNAPVTGTVSCVVSRNKGGYSSTVAAQYSGATVQLKTGKLRKKGRYTVACTYTPPSSDSVYKSSSASGTFKVKKRRK